MVMAIPADVYNANMKIYLHCHPEDRDSIPKRIQRDSVVMGPPGKLLLVLLEKKEQHDGCGHDEDQHDNRHR